MNLNKTIKTFRWFLIIAIVLISLLVWNMGHDFTKKVESGGMDSLSGEGLGMAGILVYFYFLYLIAFIIWLSILNSFSKFADNIFKRIQLIFIFIFAIIPTFIIILFLAFTSPNPFKQYEVVKRLENEIENGKLIHYSKDSIKLYEANIVNDKIVGKEIVKYENGETRSIQNYKDGVLDGECTYYYKNGQKSESRIYKMGSSEEIKTWYENGKISYYFHPDSLYRYRWWNNGQLQEKYYNGNLNCYWEKDGTQTLINGNGNVSLWYDDNHKQKSSETIYKYGRNVMETTWSQNGFISRHDEYIKLNKEESNKIGYDCEFYGKKSEIFYEDGKLKSINYWSTNPPCKNENGENYITYEYSKDGKVSDIHR